MSEHLKIARPLQQALPAAVLMALGLWVGYESFSVEDPQPYLFPQLISIALVLLSGMALLRALRGNNRTGAGIPLDMLVRIAPAITIMAIYIFVLAPQLGFYVGAGLGFLALFSAYDPNSHAAPYTWLRRIVITVGFMSVIYVVFALGLKVQTPRGLFL